LGCAGLPGVLVSRAFPVNSECALMPQIACAAANRICRR